MLPIPFNRLTHTKEILADLALESDLFSSKEAVEQHFGSQGFENPTLVNSCTSALEVIAQSIDFQSGDEILIPSYTYVSTAEAFAKTKASILFCDSEYNSPNVSTEFIINRISPKTKAIVVMHYAGIGCEMDELIRICQENDIQLIEDAAHCINASKNGKILGTFGDASALSFHHTKNIHCFAGGLLSFKNRTLRPSVSIIIDKGTNRMEFENGKNEYYEWVGHGSSYEIPALNAAFLSKQIAFSQKITDKRRALWKAYFTAFKLTENYGIKLPFVTESDYYNGHIFSLVFPEQDFRDRFQAKMAARGIDCRSHYRALHNTKFGIRYRTEKLPNAEKYNECLLRFPMYYDLEIADVERIVTESYEVLRLL